MAVGLWLNGAYQRHIELLISYFFRTAYDVVDDVVIFDKFSHSVFRTAVNKPVYRVDTSFKGAWSQNVADAEALFGYLGIDTLIVFKTDLRDNFRYKRESGGRTLINGSHRDDKYSSTFLSSKAQLENLKFVEAAASACDNVYQYALDPDEARLETLFNFKNFARLYFNDNDRQGTVFIPYHEYSMVQEYHPLDQYLTNTFCFHATANNAKRQWLIDAKPRLESITGYDVHIKVRGERGTSNQRDYMAILQRSRFTLVVAAYDNEAFSWPRLFEAACCGCLPFVMSDCNLQDVEQIYPDVCDIIRSELMVDSLDDMFDLMDNMPEEKRRRIVYDIMTSESIKKVTCLDWLKHRWQVLKGLGGMK